jgi:hypothetical protein
VTSVAIIHYPGATAKSRSVVASLVADELSQGHNVTVVDISAFTTINQDLPPAWLAQLVGHKVDHDALRNEVVSLGARYVLAERSVITRELSELQKQEISPAVESELLTYFRTDRLAEEGAKARKLRAQLWAEVHNTFCSLSDLFTATAPDIVMIPNGRTSRQKTARVVAESSGLEVLFYENGRAKPDHYYLGTTQPHDRISSQAEVASLTHKLSKAEISALSAEFLASRMSSSHSTNQYSRKWTENTPHDLVSQKPEQRAVFFPSSFDEFLAFGDMWMIDSWAYQFAAFDAVMTLLEKDGVALEMRLHPNLANKSRSYFLREIANATALQLKHPSLTIHWHNSPTNSYGLLSRADRVFVERSTIGLEAALLGLPVWVGQASQWDDIADIRRLLKPEDVEHAALTPWEPDTRGAERFVAYWMMQEHPLHYSWQDWSSWNPERSPLFIKILSLCVRNPWSHRVHLLRVEWTRWRNHRFFSSAVAATNK